MEGRQNVVRGMQTNTAIEYGQDRDVQKDMAYVAYVASNKKYYSASPLACILSRLSLPFIRASSTAFAIAVFSGIH